MSKTAGNFITLSEAVDKYGASVTRFITANASDDTSDGNFNKSDVDPTVLALYAEINNIVKVDFNKMISEDKTFVDNVHLLMLYKIIKEVENSYDQIEFRNIINKEFYEINISIRIAMFLNF